MKFLVLGHLCHDVVHSADGRQTGGYGGIFYAVSALAALMEKGDRVIPVFGVNADDYGPLLDTFSRVPGIDTSGIFRFDGPTNTVHLTYAADGMRTECSRHIAAPIPFDRIRPFLSVDGILVNLISGSDLTLETLDHLRMAARQPGIPVHLDLHSLTLGVTAGHERFRRPVEQWRRWVFMIDTIQGNEEEIGGLTPDGMSEEQAVGHMATLGVKGVLVTRGPRGATLYTADRKRMLRTEIPGIPVSEVRDATGCGDVFGAAFLLRYVRTGDPLAAARFANQAAAQKAALRGDAALTELKTLLEAP